MAKKGVKIISPEKKAQKTERSEKSEVPKMLVENFVALQSVMADLSSKLNNLSNQMSKLLELFEESAKAFMDKDIKFAGAAGAPDKDMSEKLDKLLEQNKIIARGLTLLHESNAAPAEEVPQQQYPPQAMPPSPQQFTQQMPDNRYQRSISSR